MLHPLALTTQIGTQLKDPPTFMVTAGNIGHSNSPSTLREQRIIKVEDDDKQILVDKGSEFKGELVAFFKTLRGYTTMV
jgi:hypothetical protein